ncbi:MAG: exodeoxyribonuclease VII small subunit [Clostridia bacterium]|nr:exodeoxyribonuclease VII small subunit [Clostridia bacterium]
MAAKKKQTFEERLLQVESLIAEMESGAMPLEEALRRYEEGMEALAALEKELQSAQQKLTVLRRVADGTEEEVPLEVAE